MNDEQPRWHSVFRRRALAADLRTTNSGFRKPVVGNEMLFSPSPEVRSEYFQQKYPKQAVKKT